MNISSKLAITTAVAGAMMVAACGQSQPQNSGWSTDQDTAVCVDRQGNRVDEDRCDDDYDGIGAGAFMLFYMSRGGYVPAYGHKVNPKYGSYKPSKGRSYLSPSKAFKSSSVSRGGFGSSARSSVGG